MVSDRYQRGLDRMMELVSTEHTNTFDHAKLVESYSALDPDLPDYIVSFAFGDIYSRTSLTQQEQTLVTISTLVALGTEPQLKLHINTGFNVGLTKEKIVGALIHCIPYVGFPRVLNGLTLLKEVMAERGLAPEADAALIIPHVHYDLSRIVKMHLVIGLGPIGGNVGARLAELGRDVYGYDLSPDRVREWSEENTSPAGGDLAAVDWPSVDSVHIAVRLADQVSSVFDSLQDHAGRPLSVFVHTTLAPKDPARSSRRLPAPGGCSRPPFQAARRGRAKDR